jgi:hypothetical protein
VPFAQVVMMCQPKAAADPTLPAAVVGVVVVSAAVSSAAAVITGALIAVLAVLGVLSAVGVAGFVYVLRRDQMRMWRPAPARQVAVRSALPAAPPAPAISAPRQRAIEAPAAIYVTTTGLVDGVLTAIPEDEMMPAGR